MSKETEKLRREVRADLALMWANQSDANGRIEQLSRSIELHADQIAEQGQKIAEQGQKIAEQGQKIAEQGLVIQASMRQTAALGREVADLGTQLVGRLKQFDKRFGKFLSAVEKDSDQRFQALEERVTRLEERGDPAA
jgi:chromosome segregation ATPase